MTISFITVTLNNKKGLLKTLNSYNNFKKLYKKTEIVIVDSLSSDGTQLIVKNFSNIIDKYIYEKDEGIYDAMNKGIDNVIGDFICFMNAGDVIISDQLFEFSKKFKSNTTCYIGGVKWDKKLNNFKYLNFCPYLLRLPNHQAMIIPSKYCFKFNKNYKIASDLDQKIKILKINNYSFTKNNIVLCESGGKSQNIKSYLEIFSRASEFYKIAFFHYGLISAVINYSKFIIWHSFNFIKKKFKFS
jgi:glycosyltransferase involved in cell wall biosynthesis